MVSRLFSTAGSYLNSFGEVLAPTVQTPLEDFKQHWRSIRKFYIDHNDDIETFQASQLPEHLVTMVNLLIQESSSSDTGPCLEFFLQNKIFEALGSLGERDSPPGVRKLVLVSITLLLSNLSLLLLPHMSVHRSLRNLLIACSQPPTPTHPTPNSELVNLLEVLTSKLKENPSLLGFFIQDPPPDELGGLVIFQALLKHLWDAGAVGERARRAIVTCLEFPLPISADNTALPIMINHTRFINLLISGLVEMFRRLPISPFISASITSSPSQSQNTLPTTPYDYTIVDHFKTYLSFCCTLSRVTAHGMGEIVSRAIEHNFLMCTLGPSLLQPTEPGFVSTITYLRESFLLITPPLLEIFVTFLLGDFKGPESKDEESEHIIRATLIKRINSDSEAVSLSVLRFFSTLLGSHNQHAMENLILRNLSNLKYLEHIETDSSSEDLDHQQQNLEHIQNSIARFLTLFGSRYQPQKAGISQSGYDAYLVDAQHQIRLYQTACSHWSVARESEQNTRSADASSGISPIGAFLSSVFAKFEKILDQDLQTNLVLTGIFAKLCYYPIPLLSAFLLSHTPVLGVEDVYTIPSLYQVMETLAKKIDERSSRFSDFVGSLEIVRNQISNAPTSSRSRGSTPTTSPHTPNASSPSSPHKSIINGHSVQTLIPPGGESPEDKRFLQAVVILEEFCKELGAILQAKIVLELVI
eukprot:TRINITY_DN2134_c0_g1_i1.p1 TRINITY_DN2134_c0_g1~~TRINITY_DN2134_c0_g1_i1.p1  ORF type:complete len:698 (-),score=96.38 TRINITY_DN2134_c0_g1_i1:103-2196(-)